MNVRVVRDHFTENSTSGALYVDGEFAAFTLEPPWKTDDVKPRAIPPGSYALTIRWSERHKRMVPHVEDVPGFAEIEIHPGNYPRDTEGCTLVGKSSGPDFVGESQLAFHELFETLHQAWSRGEPIDITYVNSSHQSALSNQRSAG